MVKEKETKESFEAQLDHAGIDQIIHTGNDQTKSCQPNGRRVAELNDYKSVIINILPASFAHFLVILLLLLLSYSFFSLSFFHSSFS